MLLKLIKYELRATGRKFYPIYAVLLISSFIFGNFYSLGFGMFDNLLAFIPFIFTCAIVVQAVVFIMVIIERFNNNLLGDEGYLMSTLPVTNRQLIASKLITSLIWAFVSLAVGLLSIYFLLMPVIPFGSLFTSGSTFTNIYGVIFDSLNVPLLSVAIGIKVFQFVFLGICQLVSTILIIYIAITIGHVVGGRFKTLLGIISYFIINWGVSFAFAALSISVFVYVSVTSVNFSSFVELYTFSANYINVMTIAYVVVCAVLFEAINQLLVRKKEI